MEFIIDLLEGKKAYNKKRGKIRSVIELGEVLFSCLGKKQEPDWLERHPPSNSDTCNFPESNGETDCDRMICRVHAVHVSEESKRTKMGPFSCRLTRPTSLQKSQKPWIYLFLFLFPDWFGYV